MRRRIGVVLVVIVGVVLAASPAGAHTAVVATEPESRTVHRSGLEMVTVIFAEPVSTKTVSLRVVGEDGADHGLADVGTPSGTAELIDFVLPDLNDGVYGLAWESVGPDGHRVFGEIVVGLGDVDATSLVNVDIATEASSSLWSLTNLIGRTAFLVGLFGSVGAAFLLHLGPLGDLRALLLRLLQVGAGTAAVGWLLRSVLAIFRVSLASSDDLLPALAETLQTRTGVAAGVGLLGAWFAVRTSNTEAERTGVAPSMWFGFVLLTLGATLNSHTVLLSEYVFDAWVSSAHLLSVAAWTGPVVLLAVAGWRQRDERSELVGLMRRYSAVVWIVVAVAVLTGGRMAAVVTGFHGVSTTYDTTLVAKVSLVVLVIVPLGALQLRWLRRAEHGVARIGVLTRAEAFAVVGVVVAALGLSQQTPSVLTADRPPELPASLEQDPNECLGLAIGQVDCLDSYFERELEAGGAAKAVSSMAHLAETRPDFAAQCHQYAHNLGNAAADWYGSITEALAVDGSGCGSGYYHGVLEQEVAALRDADVLRSEVADLCAGSEDPEPTLLAFQCVHGVGHGLMLSFDDVAEGASLCLEHDVLWAKQTCFGGVQMENVMAFFNTEIANADPSEIETTPDFSPTDPYYPCSIVDDELKSACYEQHASYLFLAHGSSPATAGDLCLALPGGEELIEGCFQGLGRQFVAVANYEPETVLELCTASGVSQLTACLLAAMHTAVNHTADSTLAAPICDSSPIEVQPLCREDLASRLEVYEAGS